MSVETKEQYVYKTFDFDVQADGDYYLSAWIMGVNQKDGEMELNIYIDEHSIPVGRIVVSSTGWQSACLYRNNDERMPLSK